MLILSSYHAQVLCAECVAKRISLPCPISSISVWVCVRAVVCWRDRAFACMSHRPYHYLWFAYLLVWCQAYICFSQHHIATHSLCMFIRIRDWWAQRRIKTNPTNNLHAPSALCLWSIENARACVCRSVEHSPIPSIAMTIFLQFYCLLLALTGHEITLFVHYIKYESITLTHFGWINYDVWRVRSAPLLEKAKARRCCWHVRANKLQH